MWFGDLATDEAVGCILAHSVRAGSRTFKKGRRLTAEDVAVMAAAGQPSVVVARLDPDADVHEDAAAAALAAALSDPDLDVQAPFTGRVNVYAKGTGVLSLDAGRIRAANHVDEGITVATLADRTRVAPKQMLATVKIIPYAVPRAALDRACACLAPGDGTASPALSVAPFRPRRVALIQTTLPQTKTSVLNKTVAVTQRRIDAIGSTLDHTAQTPHQAEPLAATLRSALDDGAEMLLIIGASAISDRRDVIPAAIDRAGGRVDHLGMPVDPGNLLLVGAIGAVPVLGLPGCARSPKMNGMDWVLERLAAGLPVTGSDIMDMGVGGLLAEVPTRPQPRDAQVGPPTAPRIAAIVLAAGQSRRMGVVNKLLEPVDGTPLVGHAIAAAKAAGVWPAIVVTGHDEPPVAAIARSMGVDAIHNPYFAEGMSTSLRAGVAALPRSTDAVLVCLGDMPGITGDHLKRLIAAYAPLEGRALVVPTVGGRRGNPVLWDRRFFPELTELAGDVGARHLIGAYEDLLVEVPFDDTAPATDIDTPDDLAVARQHGHSHPDGTPSTKDAP